MNRKTENIIKYAIISLGITSLTTQIILIREFLNIFYGNELVLGIILASWMLLTGVGSFIGKFFDKIKNKHFLIIILQVLIGLLPFISVFLLRYLRNIVFPVGSLLGIFHISAGSFVLLLPYCIVSGLMFTLFSGILSTNNRNLISNVYYLDTAGSIIGGVLFNFIFIFLLTTFQSLYFLMLINILSAILLSLSIKKYVLCYISGFIILIIIAIQFVDIDEISKSFEIRL